MKKVTWKKIIVVIDATFAVALVRGFEPLTSAIPGERSTNCANKPTGSRSLNWLVINCKSCVNNCDDRLSYSSSRRSFYIWFSYIHDFIIIFLRSIRNPIRQWPAPGWLVAQLLERCTGIADRPWRIVLLKVAYYATSSARNFATLCQLFRNSQIMLLISEIMLIKWRRFCTYRRAITTPNYDVFQINCCCKFICVLWQFVSALSCPN